MFAGLSTWYYENGRVRASQDFRGNKKWGAGLLYDTLGKPIQFDYIKEGINYRAYLKDGTVISEYGNAAIIKSACFTGSDNLRLAFDGAVPIGYFAELVVHLFRSDTTEVRTDTVDWTGSDTTMMIQEISDNIAVVEIELLLNGTASQSSLHHYAYFKTDSVGRCR